MEECSHNQLYIQPASRTHIHNGVNIAVSAGSYQSDGKDAADVNHKCTKAARWKLGGLISLFDHTDVLLHGTTRPGPSGAPSTSWTAFAGVNYYMSVYNDGAIKSVTTQQHEISHNLSMMHAGESGDQLGDYTGAMGGGPQPDDASKCYNAPHSWFLGWYQNRHIQFNNDDVTDLMSVALTGIDDWTSGSGDTIIARIADGCYCGTQSYCVMYNHNVGINADVGEQANFVMVVQDTKSGTPHDGVYDAFSWHNGPNVSAQSWLVAQLGVGDDFVMDFF